MRRNVGNSVIELVEGDITREETDAIINAANSSLLGGGGVDGAIHRAGGPAILEECRKLGGCPPGEAKITTAGKLKAKHVIHTVGPIFRGGNAGEEQVLSNAYRNCLIAASQEGLKSLSFPSISTGAYGYPVEKAALTALSTIKDFLIHDSSIELVRFVLFGTGDYNIYQRVLEDLL
ncbi:MAG: O-acetyl-ADP-ribose deacetylase [Deltaproteobacteria bacterium]|nr:O-acetyl-ADP-ribose deacetylase [Deltaproteobacteria bacterium]